MTAFDQAWSLVKRGLLDDIHGESVVISALSPTQGTELRPIRTRHKENQRFSRTGRGRSPDHIMRPEGGPSLLNTKGRVSDIGKVPKSPAEEAVKAKLRIAGEEGSR